MDDTKIVRTFKVFGRVQGVGFRWYVREKARELNVSGDVRNCPDGTVEVRAIGTHDELDRFLKQLEIGPAHGKVDKVDVQTWATADAQVILSTHDGSFTIAR